MNGCIRELYPAILVYLVVSIRLVMTAKLAIVPPFCWIT